MTSSISSASGSTAYASAEDQIIAGTSDSLTEEQLDEQISEEMTADDQLEQNLETALQALQGNPNSAAAATNAATAAKNFADAVNADDVGKQPIPGPDSLTIGEMANGISAALAKVADGQSSAEGLDYHMMSGVLSSIHALLSK